jgi:5-methylthioadenosine/S-adenosylhomocysteine deaminase
VWAPVELRGPEARRLHAAWVVPVAQPPIRDGALLIGPDGRIAAVGPDAVVPWPPGVPNDDFPDAILLPGLVNAHTHLELTGLGQPEAREFHAWLTWLRARKGERTPADFLAAARAGVRACWAAGVTTVADTGDSGAVARALAEAGGSGLVFVEVFGPHPAQCEESIRDLRERLHAVGEYTGPRVRLGVSPHAPYTVSGPLFRAVAALAEGEDLPIAVHVAESPAESALIATGEGPFADGWRRRGIPLPDDMSQLAAPLPLRTPVRWLDAQGVLGPATLCIHAVQVDPDDVFLLARREVGVAHCPRSNAHHGHGPAPLRLLLDAGIRLGLGTDSEASVGSLDLFAEAREARRLAGLAADETLRLMTVDAALAIGIADVGLLAEGAWGDACLVNAGEEPVADPVEVALVRGSSRVQATYLAGRPVWRGP